MAYKYKCAFCRYQDNDINKTGKHYIDCHKSLLPDDMEVNQFVYYIKTGKKSGSCIICKKPTDWNSNTNKYNRFCNNPRCKEIYREEFKKRMIGKYGQIHLLNDPQKQKEMLAKRKISGVYTWSNGKAKFGYTGSYELDFLKYLDYNNWDYKDLMSPAPQIFEYKYGDKDHFYMPDFYIPSLNLIIEIKDGDPNNKDHNANRHHKITEIDRIKEKAKDDVMRSLKSQYNYIKILNKDYKNFQNYLKNQEPKYLFESYDVEYFESDLMFENIYVDDFIDYAQDKLDTWVNDVNAEEESKEINDPDFISDKQKRQVISDIAKDFINDTFHGYNNICIWYRKLVCEFINEWEDFIKENKYSDIYERSKQYNDQIKNLMNHNMKTVQEKFLNKMYLKNIKISKDHSHNQMKPNPELITNLLWMYSVKIAIFDYNIDDSYHFDITKDIKLNNPTFLQNKLEKKFEKYFLPTFSKSNIDIKSTYEIIDHVKMIRFDLFADIDM